MIAYCGLACNDCEAYLATQADDRDALARVAAKWREEYNAPTITIEGVVCDGCVAPEGRRCGHWYECDIRACGAEHAVENCAHCAEYACARLEHFFGLVPEARARLDQVRQSL